MYCKLCQNEMVFLSSHCEQCTKIKRILNVYGRDNVLSILENVCLRTKQQQKNKMDLMKSVRIEPKKSN